MDRNKVVAISKWTCTKDASIAPDAFLGGGGGGLIIPLNYQESWF